MVSSRPSRQPDLPYRTARGKRQHRSGVVPLDHLPRWCPVCEAATIIGHGRRLRQAHDHRHTRMWIRRGLCRQCNNTFTILPDSLVPFGHYSLPCRRQACEEIAAGESAEQATLHCKDPARLPDPSTLRRWVQRRVLSLCCWVKAALAGTCFFAAPTILAWDLSASCRMLRLEAKSP
jgi:Domain of unknown function (DUF6431)